MITYTSVLSVGCVLACRNLKGFFRLTCRESLILLGLSTVCYIITAVVSPTVVHRYGISDDVVPLNRQKWLFFGTDQRTGPLLISVISFTSSVP